MTVRELKDMLNLLPQRLDNETIRPYDWATAETFDIEKKTQEQMEEELEEFGVIYLDQRPRK